MRGGVSVGLGPGRGFGLIDPSEGIVLKFIKIAKDPCVLTGWLVSVDQKPTFSVASGAT